VHRDPITLRFADSELERRFQVAAGASFVPQFRLGLVVATGLWAVAAFLLPLFTPVDPWLARGIVAAMVFANAVGLSLARPTDTLDRLQAIGVALNMLGGLAVLGLAVAASQIERYATPALMLISIFAFVVLRLRFVAALAASAVYLGAYTAVALLAAHPRALVVDLFILYSAVGAAAAATYFLESASRELFAQRELIAAQEQAIRSEKAKSDRLLRNILPDAVAAELREEERSVAVSYPAATVLFADLVGFTPLTERMPPEATAAMLNEVYSAFDDVARRHGVEKIKTIGDSYMLAGGVPEPCTDHAARVVTAGLAMLEAVGAYAARSGTGIALRVGVHSGPLVAGVIGKAKFSYDLWGDTVNTASRMESHGVAGAVQISEATRQRVANLFEVTPRGEIEIKGKGRMPAFLVIGRLPQP
jgi:adenylate cyclase